MNKQIKNMSYNELERKLISNRAKLRATKSIERRGKLIAENHDIMVEMDSRW